MGQVEALAALTAEIDRRGINVELGAVNNTAEAILYCNEKGIGSYSGGTCNETNRSAEVTTNIAMACGALQVLAKPGMGVDEGFMIVNNEMNRVMALVNR